MSPRLLLPALTAFGAVLATAVPAAAAAPDYARGHVVVRYHAAASRADRKRVQKATGTAFTGDLPGGARTLRIRDGQSVRTTLEQLRRRSDVDYAVPDYEVRAAQFIPNDPGRDDIPGDWRRLQWNFFGPASVNAPGAWDYARAAGAPGGRGVVVAVIDSGVAYERSGRYRRAPDLYPGRFVKPYDFVQDDRHPNDEESHGTHVTGTIAQKTNNGFGVTGLAYGVKIMPLRVLNAEGGGRASYIARAIRYAARNGADVINMSVEFDLLQKASGIPEVISAIRYAHRKNVVMVAASGNDYVNRITYPAKDERVIAVGATTDDACKADYSNTGKELDLVAPGGGDDAALSDNPWDKEHCDPAGRGRGVVQETFTSSYSRFGLVSDAGTSFSSPHVAAIAALLIASKRLGDHPTALAVEKRLEATAHDIGATGPDTRYGAGLVDAQAALAPDGAGQGGTTAP
ncbi:MAG: serine protease [Thermoleophilaceae bacterium]|nr:serine protease [Thermoleophilaceae bacterium]